MIGHYGHDKMIEPVDVVEQNAFREWMNDNENYGSSDVVDFHSSLAWIEWILEGQKQINTQTSVETQLHLLKKTKYHHVRVDQVAYRHLFRDIWLPKSQRVHIHFFHTPVTNKLDGIQLIDQCIIAGDKLSQTHHQN